MINEDITNKAIAANLEALERLLYNANVCASESVVAMKLGERNGAIGALFGIEDMLKQAAALYGAAVALHRGR